MEQSSLFHESLTEALRATVAFLGGAKAVAGLLWPEKAPDEANRHLLDCLNPDRPARLDPDHLLLLLKTARSRGCHTAMAWIAAEVGYSVHPVEPEDEDAELQRQAIAAVEHLNSLVKRMERLRGVSPSALSAVQGGRNR